MNKIRTTQLFTRVAGLEDFSHTADTLGLPRSSVLRQIQALENHLGTQLLHRTTRRVQLAQDGMIYYERTKDLLSSLDELDGLLHRGPSSISGKLHVGMPVGITRNLMMPRLPNFLHQYPGLELELSSSGRLVNLIRKGFDCAVRAGTLKDLGLIAHSLGKLTQISCASPQCLARFGYPESLEDLASHAVMRYSVNLGTRARGFEVATEDGTQWVKTDDVLAVDSTETYYAAYLTSLDIIQVPRIGVHDTLCTGTLVGTLLQYRAGPMSISLLYPHRRNLPHRVRLFIEWLTGAMKDYMD